MSRGDETGAARAYAAADGLRAIDDLVRLQGARLTRVVNGRTQVYA